MSRPTVAHLAARAIGAPVVAAGVVAGWLVFAGGPAVTVDSAAVVQAGPSAADRMVQRHSCWTLADGAPAEAGEFPGHVVVVEAGATRPTYSRRLVGPALEQIGFDHPELGWESVDHGLDVRGFCR